MAPVTIFLFTRFKLFLLTGRIDCALQSPHCHSLLSLHPCEITVGSNSGLAVSWRHPWQEPQGSSASLESVRSASGCLVTSQERVASCFHPSTFYSCAGCNTRSRSGCLTQLQHFSFRDRILRGSSELLWTLFPKYPEFINIFVDLRAKLFRVSESSFLLIINVIIKS